MEGTSLCDIISGQAASGWNYGTRIRGEMVVNGVQMSASSSRLRDRVSYVQVWPLIHFLNFLPATHLLFQLNVNFCVAKDALLPICQNMSRSYLVKQRYGPF